MEQSRALHCERDQLLLEWIAFAIIGVQEEAGAEGYEVMYIWNGRPVDIRELDDEALAGRAAQRHAAGTRCRPERVVRRSGLRVCVELEILAPDAGSLQSLAFGAVRLELIAFDLAFSTC